MTISATGPDSPGSEHRPWDPHVATEGRNPVEVYDEMRERCPVAPRVGGAWTLFSYAAAMEVVGDPHTYSNSVSRFLQVPNGLDGEEHAAVRAAIDPYFEPDRMVELEPRMERVAGELVGSLKLPAVIDAVELGSRYAVRAQCEWLGWPADLEGELIEWMADNHAATRSRDTTRTADVAARFDAIIGRLMAARRGVGSELLNDVTSSLMREHALGRQLSEAEVTSVLRNFTGGDLGSMALCAGVVLTYLADHPDVQAHIRQGVSNLELDAMIDEMLRIDDPFVANRRMARRDVALGGHRVKEGDVVIINWTSANRDEEVFGNPDQFDPERNAPHNVVYGAGKHVCPGRPLATLELRVFVRAAIEGTAGIEPVADRARIRETPPLGGYEFAPVLLR